MGKTTKQNRKTCVGLRAEKEPLPGEQTEKRQAGENGGHKRPITPPPNDTTMPERVQGFFEGLLPKGAENAIKSAELLKMVGLSDQRALRKMISDERAAGAVILSGETGYYLPDDGDKGRLEAAAFVATVTAKGINTLRAARSAQEYLSKLPGQMEIGGGAVGRASGRSDVL